MFDTNNYDAGGRRDNGILSKFYTSIIILFSLQSDQSGVWFKVP